MHVQLPLLDPRNNQSGLCRMNHSISLDVFNGHKNNSSELYNYSQDIGETPKDPWMLLENMRGSTRAQHILN